MGVSAIKLRHTTIEDPITTILRMESLARGPFLIDLFAAYISPNANKTPYRSLFVGLNNAINVYTRFYKELIRIMSNVLVSSRRYEYLTQIVNMLASGNYSKPNPYVQWSYDFLISMSPEEVLNKIIVHSWFTHGKIPPNKKKISVLNLDSGLQPHHLYTKFKESKLLYPLVSVWALIHFGYGFANDSNTSSAFDEMVNAVWEEYSDNLTVDNLSGRFCTLLLLLTVTVKYLELKYTKHEMKKRS